jgi:tRNA(Ile)-lysidine synthase TilS/MesJ
MYAYFKKLDYFSTECIYSPNAYRGYARTFLKDLEALRPSAILGGLHRHGVPKTIVAQSAYQNTTYRHEVPHEYCIRLIQHSQTLSA